MFTFASIYLSFMFLSVYAKKKDNMIYVDYGNPKPSNSYVTEEWAVSMEYPKPPKGYIREEWAVPFQAVPPSVPPKQRVYVVEEVTPPSFSIITPDAYAPHHDKHDKHEKHSAPSMTIVSMPLPRMESTYSTKYVPVSDKVSYMANYPKQTTYVEVRPSEQRYVPMHCGKHCLLRA